MSYLGRGTDKISNIEILDNITFDGSSSYSITKSSVAFTPNSAQSLLISIDGVVQATNFTVSSSTIDFGVAVPSTSTCDFFLHYGVGLITTPADGTVSLAKLSATGTKDATTFLRGDNTFASAGSPSIVDNGNATAITIDSSERVGIGTTSPTALLELFKAGTTQIKNAYSSTKYSLFGRTGGNYYWSAYEGGANLIFSTSASDNATTERMRILSGGGVVIAKTSETIDDTGHEFRTNGFCAHTRTSDTVLLINRMGSDGTLQEFEADGNLEGTISVSGSTVSYNGFTGTHWSRFQNNSIPTILKGTVLETLDEMCDWYNLEFDVTTTTQDADGNDVTKTHTEKVPHVLTGSQSAGDVITYNHKGTDYQATIVKETDVKHMMSKVSDTVDAKNVYGVFVAYDLDGEGYNDFYVASVGSFVVRIKQGETIFKGDLLQSNGDGTAKVQTDDAVRSSSFAKVLSTTVIETYEDGSFIVPCSLMC
jgi:hypothetical protein